MMSKGLQFWQEQITLAKQTRITYEKWWDANLKAYAPPPGQDPDAYGSCINTNRDFTLVERKKADLFFQRPEVTTQPSPLLDGPMLDPMGQPMLGPPDQMGQQQPIGQHAALQAHQEILNEKLGPDGIDAVRMVHCALFDVLSTSGLGWTKMGYESVTVEQETPDPMTGETVMVPVPIHERCFWHHFSPKKALIPHDFRSTDWDTAPWLGYQFELPLTAGNRVKYDLPDDFEGSKSRELQHFDHGQGESPQTSVKVFTGVEIWYRSALYREDIQHPDHLTQLVLVDGVDEPVIEVDSPFQSLDQKGALTPDSLIGFPIHPLNMRVLTDSAYPPSDCTLIRPLVNELNRFREQMVEYRDAQTLRWMYNTDTLPKDALEKIVRSPIGGMIGVPAEAFLGEGSIKELPHGSMPRESFTSNDYIDADIARTTAIDASGAGVQSTSESTATEKQIIQANANARLDFERGVVLQWYLKGVTKFSTLLQRYLPLEHAAQIVGPQRAQVWDVWRHQVPSALAFTAMPDSALRVDQAVDRKTAQDLYSFLANDPFVNRGELLTQLLRKFHLDPAKIVQQPPPPKPEPAKVSLSIKDESLSVQHPAYPNIYQVLTQQGVLGLQQPLPAEYYAQLALTAPQMPGQETEHGGKVAQQESLSKHASDESGGMQGTGMPAAMGAGGGFLQ